MKPDIAKYIVDFINGLVVKMFDAVNLASNAVDALNGAVGNATGDSIFGYMKTIGVALLVCMFLIHLGESALKDKQDPDGLIKDIALLGLYTIITTNLKDIMDSFEQIAGGIVGLFGKTELVIQDGAWYASFETNQEVFAEYGLATLLLDALFFGIFGGIAVAVIRLIICLCLYTVKIEIFIRTLFMPLAVGWIAEDGWRGPGGRYIKKWFACYLQAAVMMAATMAYAAVCQNSMDFVGNVGENDFFMVAILAGGFAVAGICMKSSQISNDIMGV